MRNAECRNAECRTLNSKSGKPNAKSSKPNAKSQTMNAEAKLYKHCAFSLQPLAFRFTTAYYLRFQQNDTMAHWMLGILLQTLERNFLS
jgi:hypothetical protein